MKKLLSFLWHWICIIAFHMFLFMLAWAVGFMIFGAAYEYGCIGHGEIPQYNRIFFIGCGIGGFIVACGFAYCWVREVLLYKDPQERKEAKG